MSQKHSNKSEGNNGDSCSVCEHLIANLQRLLETIETAKLSSDWLTVDEIAKELRISKTIVYRLVRNGEIEAVNIVENNGRVRQRGHYRIKRISLSNYLDRKKIIPIADQTQHRPQKRYFPKVKNHLGL